MSLNFLYKLCFPLILCLFLCISGGCSGVIAPDPNVRFIAFGDSTTAGPENQNYWDLVREKLEQPPEAFAGQGEGGESSEKGLIRLNELLTGGLYPNAQVLLYWEGGDDLVEFVRNHDPLLFFSPDDTDYPFSNQLNEKLNSVQTNIEDAIKAGQNAGLTVYIGTYYFLEPNLPCKALPFPILLPEQAGKANIYVVKLNARIRLAAQNQNARLVDVETIGDTLRQNPQNYFDCNHLSYEGNELVADLFMKELQAP